MGEKKAAAILIVFYSIIFSLLTITPHQCWFSFNNEFSFSELSTLLFYTGACYYWWKGYALSKDRLPLFLFIAALFLLLEEANYGQIFLPFYTEAQMSSDQIQWAIHTHFSFLDAWYLEYNHHLGFIFFPLLLLLKQQSKLVLIPPIIFITYLVLTGIFSFSCQDSINSEFKELLVSATFLFYSFIYRYPAAKHSAT